MGTVMSEKRATKGNRKEDSLEYYVNRLVPVVNIVMHPCYAQDRLKDC